MFTLKPFVVNFYNTRSILFSLLFLLLILFRINVYAYAYDSLESPYETLYTHLNFLKPKSYNPNISAKAFLYDDIDIERAKKLAFMMRDIIMKLGISINIDDISENPNYIDPEEKYHKYKLSPRLKEVYLIKKGRNWIYSKETIRRIPDLHLKLLKQKTFELNSSKFKEFYIKIPSCLKYTLYKHINIYHLISTFVLILIVIIMQFLFKKILMKMLQLVYYLLLNNDLYYSNIKIFEKLIKAIFKIIITYIISLNFNILTNVSIENTFWCKVFFNLSLEVLFIYFISILCDFIIDIIKDFFVTHKIAFNDMFLIMYKKILKSIIILSGVVYIIIRYFPANTPFLLTSISITSVGISFALKGFWIDLLSYFIIHQEKILVKGDYVIINEDNIIKRGTIKSVKLRSTILIDDNNNLLYIPNYILIKSCITKHMKT